MPVRSGGRCLACRVLGFLFPLAVELGGVFRLSRVRVFTPLPAAPARPLRPESRQRSGRGGRRYGLRPRRTTLPDGASRGLGRDAPAAAVCTGSPLDWLPVRQCPRWLDPNQAGPSTGPSNTPVNNKPPANSEPTPPPMPESGPAPASA